MRATVPALVLLAACAVALGTGCKSKEDRVCEHVMALAEAIPDGPLVTAENCASELDEMKGECANPDDVLDCFLEQEELERVHDCRSVCQDREGE